MTDPKLKCAWCEAEVDHLNSINDGEELICDECLDNTVNCDRCERVIHQEDAYNDMCECCHDDMHG